MASITIRRLDEAQKARLRMRAASHGRSMEEEARETLREALAEKCAGGPNMFREIRRCIEPLGGVDPPLPSRELPGESPDFE